MLTMKDMKLANEKMIDNQGKLSLKKVMDQKIGLQK